MAGQTFNGLFAINVSCSVLTFERINPFLAVLRGVVLQMRGLRLKLIRVHPENLNTAIQVVFEIREYCSN